MTTETMAADELTAELEELAEGPEEICISMKKFVLEELLVKASAVVPSRDVIPVLKNFLVEVEDGLIRVIATDMAMSVVAKSEMVTVLKKGRAVFPAKRMLELVHEAAEGDIEIEVHDLQASIRVGRTQWSLRLSDDSEYPGLPDESDIEFTKVAREKFVAALSSVRCAAARDSVRPNLMMVDVSAGRMRAADGVRFQQVSVDKDFPEVQIPIYAVDDLLKIMRASEADNIELGSDDECLIFRVGEDMFVAQLLNAEFPNVDEQLLKPALANDQQFSVDRNELATAVKRVRITADEETSAVILLLTKNALSVTSRDKAGSWTREALDAAWAGKDRQVALNHNHLLDMLTTAEVPSCQFFLGKDEKTRPSPLLLKDEGLGMLGILTQLRASFVG